MLELAPRHNNRTPVGASEFVTSHPLSLRSSQWKVRVALRILLLIPISIPAQTRILKASQNFVLYKTPTRQLSVNTDDLVHNVTENRLGPLNLSIDDNSLVALTANASNVDNDDDLGKNISTLASRHCMLWTFLTSTS